MKPPVRCKHWSANGQPGHGLCAVTEYCGPSHDVCNLYCQRYEGPSRGLGDVVAKAIKVASLGTVKKPCGDCKKRQAALNAAMSFLRSGA